MTTDPGEIGDLGLGSSVNLPKPWPNAPAIRYAGRATSYRSLVRRISGLRAVLTEAGIARGHRVSLVLSGSPAALAYMAAVWNCGATVAAFEFGSADHRGANPHRTARPELVVDAIVTQEAYLGETVSLGDAPTIILSPADSDLSFSRRLLGRLTAAEGITQLAESANVLREERLFRDTRRRSARSPGATSSVAISRGAKPGGEAAPAWVAVGPYGEPAEISRDAIAAIAEQVAAAFIRPVQPGDRVLLAIPAQSALWPAVAIACWRVGATVILPRATNAESVCATIDETRPSIVVAASELVARLPSFIRDKPGRLSACRTIIATGLPPPAARIDALRNLVNADVASWFTVAPGLLVAVGPASTASELGLSPAAGNEIAIRDPVGPYGNLPLGERGEVWIDGPHLPSAGSRSGVIGALDSRGRLVISDAVSALITTAGYQIYPRRIEAALAAHPDVACAIVIAGPTVGKPVAFVELERLARRARDPKPQANSEDLIQFLKSRLSRIEWPGEVVILPALPRDKDGQILTSVLRARRGENGPQA
ncbi:MAG: AMP-binding protein, partial [Hyphomicrobiaceae bacterium]|nr:AMP-binding protein [Hyphomicrobiaceae bacterium]